MKMQEVKVRYMVVEKRLEPDEIGKCDKCGKYLTYGLLAHRMLKKRVIRSDLYCNARCAEFVE